MGPPVMVGERSSTPSTAMSRPVHVLPQRLSTDLCLTSQAMPRNTKASQAASAGAGGSSRSLWCPMEQEIEDLADLEENQELVHSSSDSDAGSDSQWQPAAPPAAAPAAAGGRGRGRGHGRGRAAAKPAAAAGRVSGRGRGGAAATGRLWIDIEEHDFTPRQKWLGVEEPLLGEIFDGLDEKSNPLKFFERTDAPESEYLERANNSERYRGRVARAQGSGSPPAAPHSLAWPIPRLKGCSLAGYNELREAIAGARRPAAALLPSPAIRAA